jgi:hypothetical protein
MREVSYPKCWCKIRGCAGFNAELGLRGVDDHRQRALGLRDQAMAWSAVLRRKKNTEDGGHTIEQSGQSVKSCTYLNDLHQKLNFSYLIVQQDEG